jgi:hypothetical protein
MTVPRDERGLGIHSVAAGVCKPGPAQAVKKVSATSPVADLKKKKQSDNMCITSRTGQLELTHANVSKK